jgi:hypothetical protein
MRRVWFEKCDCGTEHPHGYFHAEWKGKCPVPTFSREVGEEMLNALSRERNLSETEKEEVRGQLRAAGLAERMAEADRTALLQFQLEQVLRGHLPASILR